MRNHDDHLLTDPTTQRIFISSDDFEKKKKRRLQGDYTRMPAKVEDYPLARFRKIGKFQDGKLFMVTFLWLCQQERW